MAQLPLIFNLNYQRIWLADLGNALMYYVSIYYTIFAPSDIIVHGNFQVV